MKHSTRFAKLHRGLAFGLLLLVAPAALTRAQDGLPYTIAPLEGSVEFGRSVASGGDVDGDGLPDIFVADPAFRSQNQEMVGRWFVFSGVDGSMIWYITGDRAYVPVADPMIVGAFIDDLDGDRRADLVVGVPDAYEHRGLARVYSGRTGEALFEYVGSDITDRLGSEVRGLPDLTGDLVAEFALVGRSASSGHVRVYNGATGAEEFRFAVPTATRPRRIRSAGDLDSDLIPDLLVGATLGGQGGGTYGELYAVSGADGQTIWSATGDGYFGWTIAAGHDLSGDGIPDVATLASRDQQVHLLSGADGTFIGARDVPVPDQNWGTAMQFADVNADGRIDLVAMRLDWGWVGMDAMDALTGRVIHWVQFGSWHPFNYFTGNEVVSADVNGDGSDDFIMGSVGNGVHVLGGGTLLLNFDQRRDNYDLTRGQPCDFTVGGGRPGRVMHLLGSITGNGCTFIQRLGICIDLDQRIYRLGAATTDPERVARFTVQVPLNIPRGPVWLQAVDAADPARGPITSNVMQLDVVD